MKKIKSIEEKYPLLIIGKPISVAGVTGGNVAVLSVVVYADGKYLLANSEQTSAHLVANAVALIQSEISDGDEEPIELRGNYGGKISQGFEKIGFSKFMIQYVRANGLEVYMYRGDYCQ